MIYVANAFSIQMLMPDTFNHAEFYPVSVDKVRAQLAENGSFVNAIGHADTARIVGSQIGVEDLQPNRINVQLSGGDILYVCQVCGGRLPEGCAELPDGITLKWFEVRLTLTGKIPSAH